MIYDQDFFKPKLAQDLTLKQIKEMGLYANTETPQNPCDFYVRDWFTIKRVYREHVRTQLVYRMLAWEQLPEVKERAQKKLPEPPERQVFLRKYLPLGCKYSLDDITREGSQIFNYLYREGLLGPEIFKVLASEFADILKHKEMEPLKKGNYKNFKQT